MNFYRFLPWIIFTWIGFSTYWYACEIKYNNCSCFRKRPSIPIFVLTDGIDTLLTAQQNVTFRQNKATPYLTPNLEKKITGIANYLANHKNKRLAITTAYAPNETADLANKRCQNIKNEFSKQLNNVFLKGKQSNINLDSFFVQKIIQQPNPIVFQDTLFNVTELKIVAKTMLSPEQISTLQNDTVRLMFDKKTADMVVSEKTYQYIDQIDALLTQQPKLRVYIIGHTDEDDSAETNYHLGMERAIMAQKWLEKMGINPRQTLVFSEGETKPIASNKTVEGQRLNRRVELVVK
jgi:OOP family OmpA-OmpF porin